MEFVPIHGSVASGLERPHAYFDSSGSQRDAESRRIFRSSEGKGEAMNSNRVRGACTAVVLGLVLFGWYEMAAMGQSRETSMSDSIEARNKATVRAKFDAWAAGTGGPYDLLDESVTWTIVGRSLASKKYGSREAFMAEVIRPFNARMSVGLKPVIRDMYAEGDTVIVSFDASSTTIDAKPYRNTYAWFLEMRAGKIVNATAFFDSVEFNELWTRVKPKSSG
jgi:ketosteroid isomerase-like protein